MNHYRWAALLVLLALLMARLWFGETAAIWVGAVGIPLVFVYGNQRSANPNPRWQVAAGIALLFAFFALFTGGMMLLDEWLSRWAFVAATIGWSLTLSALFLLGLRKIYGSRLPNS